MFFASPSLLVVPLVVAAVGMWGLYRGRFAHVGVSSVKLWRGLETQAGGKRSRKVDPLWAMVWLGAVLAGLAMTGWHVGGWGANEGPRAKVQVAMRGLMGKEEAELWVKVLEEKGLGERVTVEVRAEEGKRSFEATVEELKGGKIFPVPGEERVEVTVKTGGIMVWREDLRRVNEPEFNVLTLGPVSGALKRVMQIQPGARVGIPEAGTRSVFLVDDPGFDLGKVVLPERALVIASSRTPLPGIIPLPASEVELKTIETPQVASTSSLMAEEKLSGVQVRRYRRVELSAEWTVLAKVEGEYPWLATRAYGNGTRLIYVSSPLTAEATNWPVDPSFVIFFTNALYQGDGGMQAATGGVREWVRRSVWEGAVVEKRWVDLTPYLTVLALGLLVGAVAMLVRRVG